MVCRRCNSAEAPPVGSSLNGIFYINYSNILSPIRPAPLFFFLLQRQTFIKPSHLGVPELLFLWLISLFFPMLLYLSELSLLVHLRNIAAPNQSGCL